MKFNEFQKLIGQDLSEYKDRFLSLSSYSTFVPLEDVGFGIYFGSPEEIEKAIDLIKLFKPREIFVGLEKHKATLSELNRKITVSPYFEEGGFIQIASIPIKIKRK